jgi:CRP-like cAMP-binding protein
VKQDSFVADRTLIDALETRSQPVPCAENCILFKQGDPPAGVYILRVGTAILTMKSESGRAVMCFEAGSESLLGLPAIIGNAPYSLTAIAQKGSVVRYVAREDFSDLIRAEPSLAIMVFQVVAAEVIAARHALSGF